MRDECPQSSERNYARMPTLRNPKPGTKLSRIPIGDELLSDIILEEQVADIPAPPKLDELQLFESEPFFSSNVLGSLDSEIIRETQQIALSNEKVKGLLTGSRYNSLGATLSAAKCEEEQSTLKHLFYNYDNNSVVEATVDIERRTIIDVEQVKYQPPATPEEISQAIEIAKSDQRIAKRVKNENLEGNGMLITLKEDDSLVGHRLIEVMFGEPLSRLPTLQALVDMSTNEVVSTSSIE
jgi:hypothetical protein